MPSQTVSSSTHPLLKFILFVLLLMVCSAFAFPIWARWNYAQRLDRIQNPSSKRLAIYDQWKSDVAKAHDIPSDSIRVYEGVGIMHVFIVFPMPSKFRNESLRAHEESTIKTSITNILDAKPDPYLGPQIKPDFVVRTQKPMGQSAGIRRVGADIACDSKRRLCCLYYDQQGDSPYFGF